MISSEDLLCQSGTAHSFIAPGSVGNLDFRMLLCVGPYLLLLFGRGCRFGRLHGFEIFTGFQFVKLWSAGDAFFFVRFRLSSLFL